ncbi:transcriptional antiterminator, BglG family [Lachnospiraceae bacterium]|nr:transcriptional antiterminator, BglG family [Lachnospiraceae bacterium]
MKVVKALNNNMVLVRDQDGGELICQGKGIGFQKRTGDSLEEEKIERRFVPESASESRHFQELFTEIPDEYWEIAEEVLEYARKECNVHVSDRIILPLCDHMAGSVERCRNSVTLDNPMLWDIKRIYPSEFRIGKHAIKVLKDRFGTEMKQDEAAFIAYHFVNAELSARNSVSADEISKLIGSVVDIVQQSFQTQLDDEEWNYQRFLTHLKFFARRVLSRECVENAEDDDIFTELSGRFVHVKNCVDRIADFILIDYHYDISSDERLYLLIHIERVTRRIRTDAVGSKE